MPDELFNFRVWENLRERYLIEPTSPPEKKAFGTMVVPVADADAALRTPAFTNASLDLTGTAGDHRPAVTASEAQRIHVKHIRKGFSTGTSGISVSIGGVIAVITNPATGASVLTAEFILGPGDSIGLSDTNDPADTGVQCTVVHEVEEFSS